MGIYEIEDLVPGVSITLREVMDGSSVTVSERTASRSLTRHALIVARVLPCGASGQPEIERGCLEIPLLLKDHLLEIVRQRIEQLQEALPDVTDTHCYKMIAPILHECWMLSILNPPIPQLANTDGEDLLWTRVRFEVRDKDALVRALLGISGVEPVSDSKDEWRWSGESSGRDDVSLGGIEIDGGVLRLETNSAERAERGRKLIEKHARDAIRHLSTTHENIEAAVRDGLRGGGGSRGKQPEDNPEIPPRDRRGLGDGLLRQVLPRMARCDRPGS